jgi:Pyridoxamine 5'-phosphate oxidase
MDDTTGHQRPSQQELDRGISLTLLGAKDVGRIVLPAPDPFVFPVNYIVVDDLVVFRTDPASHAVTRIGETILFEVDTVDSGHEAGWSVVVRGVLHDVTERAAGDARMHRLHPWAPGEKRRWLAIRIDDITGRSVEGSIRPSTHLDERGYL